jgi:hypothetical protein
MDSMRQETKAILEMVGKKRVEMIHKTSPDAEVNLVMDDSGLRAVLQVSESGSLMRMEFIESPSTAGNIAMLDDYVEIAKEVGSLSLLYPESKYSRDMVSAIYPSLVKEIRGKAGRDFSFSGFVYDDLGNVKKVS